MNPGRTRAVVVGVDGCPRDQRSFPKLAAVRASVTDIARYLSDPDLVGINPRDIRLLVNAERSVIIEQVQTAAREADEFFLFYYCGHGQTNLKDDLFLTTSDTTFELLETHAINFETIRSMVRDSKASAKAVFLDCCYSGRALEYMSASTPHIIDSIKETGTCAIASSPGDHKSLAPLGALYTLFSGEVIDTLSRGIDNDKPEITLGELFDAVSEKVVQHGGAAPQKAVVTNGADFRLSQNASFAQGMSEAFQTLSKQITNVEATVEQLQGQLNEGPRFDEPTIRSIISQELESQLESQSVDAEPADQRAWDQISALTKFKFIAKTQVLPFAIGLAPTLFAWFGPRLFSLIGGEWGYNAIITITIAVVLCFWQLLTVVVSYSAGSRRTSSRTTFTSRFRRDVSRAVFRPLEPEFAYATGHPATLAFSVAALATPLFALGIFYNYWAG